MVSLGAINCGPSTDKLQIVATTDVVADLAKGILGDDAKITVLIPPGTDPHVATLSATQISIVESADLVITNGLSLEAKMLPELRKYATDAVAVCGNLVIADYSDGNDLTLIDGLIENKDGSLDPHVWQDPDAWISGGENLLGSIQQCWPAKKGTWEKRFRKWKFEVLEAARQARMRLSHVEPQFRAVMTSHRGFAYFGRAFNYTMIVPADLESPPPQLDLVPAVIFGGRDVSEENLEPRECRELNLPGFLGELLSVHSLLDYEGKPVSYAKWIKDNAETILLYRDEYCIFRKPEGIPAEWRHSRPLPVVALPARPPSHSQNERTE